MVSKGTSTTEEHIECNQTRGLRIRVVELGSIHRAIVQREPALFSRCGQVNVSGQGRMGA